MQAKTQENVLSKDSIFKNDSDDDGSVDRHVMSRDTVKANYKAIEDF